MIEPGVKSALSMQEFGQLVIEFHQVVGFAEVVKESSVGWYP